MPVSSSELKVLIVEDHFAVRQMISMVLRAKNVPYVDSAINGKQAIDMIENAWGSGKPYHMVFLDWEMPIVSGIEVLKHFRAMNHFVNTAFVMVTAMSMQAQVMDAVKAGATAYMIKPVSQGTISKKFDEVLIWVKQMNA
jgi:two-component system chemotaxis response regulator CheY